MSRNKKLYAKYLSDKVKSKAFLTTNGTEPLWKHYKTYYDTSGRQGSNCYSFAMHDFRPEGGRANKAVPGDISTFVKNLYPSNKHIRNFQQLYVKRPFVNTNWRSCDEPVYRLLMDGKAAVVLHHLMGTRLKYDTTVKLVHKNIQKAISTTVKPNWRKVLMVVDARGGDGNSSTDFHFFSQHQLHVRDLYDVKLESMLRDGSVIDNDKNVYIAAKISAFASDRDILRRHLPNISTAPLRKRVENELLAPGARALTNLRIHLNRIPDYAILFIPRPFWIMGADRSTANVKQKLQETRAKLILQMKAEQNAKGIRVVNAAYNQCISILKDIKGREMQLNDTLGNYSEKAGWASQAMNADGSGKLIMDPILADRNHGGYDYDKPCAVVKVLDGFGMTSVPPELFQEKW